MGHEEIGGGEEDFRAGSGLQIPSTWQVVAHVQHQELHRFLPCRKSVTSSPKYLVISVQLVHKFIWNYWSIYLHGIQLKQQAKLSLSTWTVLKRFFISTWNSTFDVQAAGLCSTNSRYFLEKKCVPRSQNRANKQLSVFALCAHVHAEVLVRPLKVFCRHKHLALSEAQHVPTCSSVKQLPLQVYTAYFPHFPLFSSSLIEGITWGQGCFWEPEAQDLPPHRLSSRFNPRSPRTNPTTSDTRTQSQRR